MEHFDIEDMFGRRKRPVLKLLRRATSGSSRSAGGLAFYDVDVFVAIENVGRGSATAPYLQMEISHPYKLAPHGISVGGDRLPFSGGEALMPLTADLKTFVAKSSFVLHPDLRYEVAQISAQIRDPTSISGHISSLPDLVIPCRIAAENLRLQTAELRVGGADLTRIARGHASGRLDWE